MQFSSGETLVGEEEALLVNEFIHSLVSSIKAGITISC
jgi:hypothetical protein